MGMQKVSAQDSEWLLCSHGYSNVHSIERTGPDLTLIHRQKDIVFMPVPARAPVNVFASADTKKKRTTD